MREQIVDLYRQNFSENTGNKRRHIFNFREAREILAGRLEEAGQESKALTIRKEIAAEQKERLKELKENSTDDDDLTSAINDVIAALESLAESYSKYGRTNEALETYREILENYSLESEEVDDIQEKIAALTQTAAPPEPLDNQSTKESEEQPTEIDASESLTLSRGQRVPLTKNNPALDKLSIDFRWECDAELEIDVSAFLLGADGKTHADEDFIFYGNSEHQSGNVKYSSDSAQASMRVELKRIPDEVARISFTLTIYEAEERRQNFGCVKVFARVIDEAAQKEIFRLDLQEGFSVETAIVVGEIYRHKGEWKFNAVGAGFTGGLVALCKNFGVEVN